MISLIKFSQFKIYNFFYPYVYPTDKETWVDTCMYRLIQFDQSYEIAWLGLFSKSDFFPMFSGIFFLKVWTSDSLNRKSKKLKYAEKGSDHMFCVFIDIIRMLNAEYIFRDVISLWLPAWSSQKCFRFCFGYLLWNI